jgi:hypothetical protein
MVGRIMAHITQADAETAYTNFTQNAFNSLVVHHDYRAPYWQDVVEYHLISAGGDAYVAYFPDYNNNDILPITFKLQGYPSEFRLTYIEMTNNDPRAIARIVQHAKYVIPNAHFTDEQYLVYAASTPVSPMSVNMALYDVKYAASMRTMYREYFGDYIIHS